MFTFLLVVGAIGFLCYVHFKDWNTALPPRKDRGNRWVVITGCDSGFGRLLATQLAEKKGYGVLAGCLTETAIGELSLKKTAKEGSLVLFRLDVCKEADIKNLREIVKKKCDTGVWAVVNNAGIGIGSMADWTPMDELRKMFDINFFGMVAVTDALLDSIRNNKGRIINIASAAGRFAGKGLSGYSASKFAVEGYSDSLRREQRLHGVTVHLFEPGFHATQIVDKERVKNMINKYWDNLSTERKAAWGEEEKDNMVLMALKGVVPADPQNVIDRMIHCVTGVKPWSRYLIGKDAFLFGYLAMLPACISDPVSRGLELYFRRKVRNAA